jgi:hypothetical protein
VDILQARDEIIAAAKRGDIRTVDYWIACLIQQGKRAQIMRMLDVSTSDGTIGEYEVMQAPYLGEAGVKLQLEIKYEEESEAA